MLTKWNYCRNLSHERFTALAKRFATLTKGTGTESDDVKGNPTIELLLLLKYVYCKIILNNEQLIADQPFLSVEEIISCKKYPIAVKRQVLTDGIIMDENNNLTISYENFTKCLRILDDFQIVARYADLVYAGGINNYIQNYDKYVTKSFCQNVEKIASLHIWQRLDVTAYECPIIFYQNNNLVKDNSWAADNMFERFDKIIDWLLERCKHIETFEIGLFAATSQTLYITEGFDAFKKFLIYAESLDDENRIRFVNVLISIFNNFNKNVEVDNYFYIIPKIIMTLDLCDKFLEYPLSVAGAVLDAASEPPIFEDFRIKSCTNFQLFNDGIENLRNNPDNIVRKQDCETKSGINFQQLFNKVKDFIKNHKKNVVEQTFERNKTIPMQSIIDEYDKLAKKCGVEIEC